MQGYIDFFSKYNIRCEVAGRKEVSKLPHQVEWFFMGSDHSQKDPGIIRIHEYMSPSMPPLGSLKDLYKSWSNVKPDLRIFLNEHVRSCFHFRDRVPYRLVDVGIPEAWMQGQDKTAKVYDFIYVGDLGTHRRPEVLLDVFTRPHLQQHSLLLLSSHYEHLQKKYSGYKNILFRGPVSREQVRGYIGQSRFAINYIPDIAPFNALTSTKLLEYAACKVPIISTDYGWVRHFEEQYGGQYFYLAKDWSNLTWENVNEFPFSFPYLAEWTWEKQFRKSGVLEFLEMRWGKLGFFGSQI